MTVEHRSIDIPPRSEYRLELEPGERVSLRLDGPSASNRASPGDAEVFGSPLLAGESRWYPFAEEAKIAVTSWGGASLSIAGDCSTEYLSDEKSPVFGPYSRLCLALEKRRILARERLRKLGATVAADDDEADLGYTPEGQGPRVMIMGPESAGKSTLVKLLTNYAMRSAAVADVGAATGGTTKEDESAVSGKKENQKRLTGWWPVIINLDSSEGAPPIPGTYSLLPLTPLPQSSLASTTPSLPFGLTPLISGALPPVLSSVHSLSALTLWTGKTSFRENEDHSKTLVLTIADALERRMKRDLRARISGVIIDMPDVVTADVKSRYGFFKYCIDTFKADVLIVLGQEKLTIELTKTYAAANPPISIIKLPKSGGAVDLDESYRNRLRSAQIRSYFYGSGGGSGSRVRPVGEDGDPSGAEGGGLNTAGGDAGNAGDALPGLGPDAPLGGLPPLGPFSTTHPFDLLEIYRVGRDSIAPSSALPIGASRTVTQTQLVKLDPLNSAADQAALLHSVVALVQPVRGGGKDGAPDSSVDPPPTDEEIMCANVLGFLHISDIDTVKKRFTVLQPSPGRLPSRTALLGAIDWQDA